MPDLDDRWKTWIWQNVGRGCHKDHIFKVLIERGFAYETVSDELRHEPTVPLEAIEVPMVSGLAERGQLDPVAFERRQLAPFLWEIPNLLSASDCEVVIEAARDRLTPSTVVQDINKQGEEGEARNEHRTSSGVALHVDSETSPELVAVAGYLRGVISDLTNLPEDHQEGFQILRYDVDERFDPHRDDFRTGSEYLRWEGLRGGQRLFSFMAYLNDVEEGGETVFPELGFSVPAERGKGIFWANVLDDGRPYAAVMHGSVPVAKGKKWLLVCWIREAPFGKALEHPGISDLRGLDVWIPPEIPTVRPDWIVEATREQLRTVPYLDAGGPECRGFEKRPVDPDLYQEVLSTYRSVESELMLEEGGAIGTFVSTVRPDLPPSLYREVEEFNALVHKILKPLHEEWCRFELTPSACYGFRVCLPGAFLHDHVDRPHTHVISSTLCVDRDVYTPWNLHAVDADGQEREVSVEPGELLLYESARIPHGRPVPLNGRFYAGLFVHYQPAEDYALWVESPRDWYARHRP